MANFHASIGYTYAPYKEYFMEEDTLATDPSTFVADDEESEAENDDLLLDDIYEGSI